MSDELRWKLSNTASKDIDWPAIEDVLGALANRQRKAGPTAAAGEPVSPEEREAARRAFVIVEEEFSKSMRWIRTTIRLSIAGVIGAVVLAVIGGALLQVSPWASAISIASVASLFALLPKAFGLARDRAMLELLPTRYSLALELCTTKSELQKLLSRFLDETSSMRKQPSTRRPRQ